MKTPEEQLNTKNKIAATLGTQEVQDILQEFLEIARKDLKMCVPTEKDPHSYNLHRALGRVEELEYLILQGKMAVKPTEKKKGQSK